MPLYEYECDACGKRFEIIQKFSDPAPDACRLCGGAPVRRLMSSPAIQFKGTGWYITDYSQKGKSSTSDSGETKTDSKDGKESKETKTADTASSTEKKPAAPTAAPAKSEG